jgi:hypothetical protein
MFENGIRFSQVLALIRVTHEPKHIWIRDGDLSWRTDRREIIKENKGGSLSIQWDRGIGSGSDKPFICFSLKGFEYSTEWTKERGIWLWREKWDMITDGNHHCLDEPSPILEAYYYYGDNCNERTDFIWQMIALNTKVYDDIGIVGGGWGKYSNGIISGCKGDNFMAREKQAHDKLHDEEWEKMQKSGRANDYVRLDR